MEGRWRFWDYISGTNNPIENWYQGLSEDAQYLFDSMLKNISKVESPLQWTAFKRFLQGKLKEERIWELAFRADRRQYRILGIFGKQRKEAVLLLGCYHKDKKYTPTDALETAFKRARDFREGRARIRERPITTDF